MERKKRVKDEKIAAVEEILREFKYLDPHIEQLKMAIKELDLMDGIGSIDYAAVRSGGTNKISSITEKTAIEKAELREKLERQVQFYEVRKKRVLMAIDCLDMNEKLIIKTRYFENKSYIDIALQTQFCRRQCDRIRVTGLQRLIAFLCDTNERITYKNPIGP